MAVNVRVVSRDTNSKSNSDAQFREFKKMLSIFRKAVIDNGCLNLWKQKQTYESPGEKRRRKQKEGVANKRKEERNRNGE